MKKKKKEGEEVGLIRTRNEKGGRTHFGNAQVLNRRNFVTCIFFPSRERN